MSSAPGTAPYTSRMWLILLGLALGAAALRLAGLGLYPLMDTAEARYAEIARKMVELEAFVVPMYTYTEPFWGKPPLAFWASAISLDWFGPNALPCASPTGGLAWPQWPWSGALRAATGCWQRCRCLCLLAQIRVTRPRVR